MLVALAALLIHPQLGLTLSTQSAGALLEASTPAPLSADLGNDNGGAPESGTFERTVLAKASAQPFETGAAPPEAPAAVEPVPGAASPVNVPAPAAFLHPGNPLTVSVAELKAENRRNMTIWRSLAIASSAAATFDAWSTRHALTTAGAQELNPLLKPFAGNASLYAAVQVGPVLMDFAARKMMYSRHSWLRRVWWVPQSASFVGSLFCGAHNLGVR